MTKLVQCKRPLSAHRAQVTPAKRGKTRTAEAPDGPAPVERRTAMTRAQRLKRVFKIDIETCKDCGGHVKIIACIEPPAVIEKILRHLERKDDAVRLLSSRHSKPSENRTNVWNFSEFRRPNHSHHPFEAAVDGCSMPSEYFVKFENPAFILPTL